MSNQVEQIRAEVERQYINARGAADWSGKEITRGESLAFKQVLDFIDALLAKENPILVPESKETPIEVCGKKVMVRYTRDGQPCEKCVFGEKDSLCQRVRDECSRLDKVGMEIDERAYFVEAPQETQAAIPDCLIPYCKGCAKFLYGECTRPLKDYEPEETHSLQEWARIMAERPALRAEFDKMCPPQPIRGSIAAEADVDKWVVTNAFLHCEKAGKIVSEMYGDKFNNQRNRNKYLAFLQQVNLDDRFGELAKILQRYGAMPALKEQPVSDLEAEIERYESEIHGFESSSRADCLNIARHFAEWGAEHLKR